MSQQWMKIEKSTAHKPRIATGTDTLVLTLRETALQIEGNRPHVLHLVRQQNEKFTRT